MGSFITAVLVDAYTGIPVDGHDDIDDGLYERCSLGIRSLALRAPSGTWGWVTTDSAKTLRKLGHEVREVRMVHIELIVERFLDELCAMFARIAVIEVERQCANEKAYARQMNRFYGDIGPQTIDEQLNRIWRDGARSSGAR